MGGLTQMRIALWAGTMLGVIEIESEAAIALLRDHFRSLANGAWNTRRGEGLDSDEYLSAGDQGAIYRIPGGQDVARARARRGPHKDGFVLGSGHEVLAGRDLVGRGDDDNFPSLQGRGGEGDGESNGHDVLYGGCGDRCGGQCRRCGERGRGRRRR